MKRNPAASPPPVGVGMLRALNVLYRAGKRHIYAGTVPEAEIARRRRRNKEARKSRRINRKRNS